MKLGDLEIMVDTKVYENISNKYDPEMGSRIKAGTYKAKIVKLNHKGKIYFLSNSGQLMGNIFDSRVYCYSYEPIEHFKGEVIYSIESYNYKIEQIQGLVFNCKGKEYVLTGRVDILRDPSTMDFITNETELRELEKPGRAGWWRGNYDLVKINNKEHFSYLHYQHKQGEDECITTYVREKDGPRRYSIPLDGIAKLSKLFKDIIPTNKNKVIRPEHQMALF